MAETTRQGPRRPWATSSRTDYHNAGRQGALDPGQAARAARPDHPAARRQLEQQAPRLLSGAPRPAPERAALLEPRTELERLRERVGQLAAELFEAKREIARLRGQQAPTPIAPASSAAEPERDLERDTTALRFALLDMG